MKQFVDVLRQVKDFGRTKKDRTGTGTKSIFGHQMRFNMNNGFPLLQLKKTHTKSIIHELLWFLGNHMKDPRYKALPQTNIKYLTDNKVRIWDEWADKDGNLGPVYGKQWTAWEKTVLTYDTFSDFEDPHIEYIFINQIQVAIDRLKTNPEDRGIIISAWNVGELKEMKLRPCHTLFQLYAEELDFEERVQWFFANYYETGLEMHYLRESLIKENLDAVKWHDTIVAIPKYRLSLQLYQRSADLFLGVPFNIASYSLLLHMIAQVTNMVPHEFIWSGGDVHIYSNHMEQVDQLLSIWDNLPAFDITRKSEPPLPTLRLNPDIKDIFDFKFEDITIIGDNPLSTIKAPVAI